MTHSDIRFTHQGHWNNIGAVTSRYYTCPYCSSSVGSGAGYQTSQSPQASILVCPQCNSPTFFTHDGIQWPASKGGQTVSSLPWDTKAIHEEARSAIAANAPTGAAMLCRKILMHVAVEKGAKENQNFAKYVGWLIEERYAPKGAEDWLKYIRERANDANHEIMVMSKEEATAILLFTEALLRNVYELPSLVPSTSAGEHTDEDGSETPELAPE